VKFSDNAGLEATLKGVRDSIASLADFEVAVLD